jgi:hypothetical protein
MVGPVGSKHKLKTVWCGVGGKRKWGGAGWVPVNYFWFGVV